MQRTTLTFVKSLISEDLDWLAYEYLDWTVYMTTRGQNHASDRDCIRTIKDSMSR